MYPLKHVHTALDMNLDVASNGLGRLTAQTGCQILLWCNYNNRNGGVMTTESSFNSAVT